LKYAYSPTFHPPDCNVPLDYEDDLGNWVAEQRKAYLDNKLSSDRMSQLDALGFIEEKDEDSVSDEENDDDDNDDEEREDKKEKAPRVKVTLAERWETNYEKLVRFYK
jgi:Helicase associated domain